VAVVRARTDGTRELVELRWGLVPHWNANPRRRGFINACAQTAAAMPSFRDPFLSHRCLVPVGGRYEWEHRGKRKQPNFIRPAGGGLFVFAGPWDRWESPAGPVDGVALQSVPANELVRPLHDRMPAILAPGQFGAWLYRERNRPQNQAGIREMIS
jgi:putative SOS response-associated peptidase YedK